MNDSPGRNTPNEAKIETGVFDFLDQQQGLRDHWYPIGFSHELNPNQPKRQLAFDVPILLWRTASRNVQAFLDICPHRQAQLSLGRIDESGLSCPYHGWRFGTDGKCNHVPVSPTDCLPREPASLTHVPVHEHAGMIWAWMGQSDPKSVPDDLEPLLTDGPWRLTRAKRVFPFDLDDLIENFMDFAHTSVVHPGLIRGITKAKERGVTIETNVDSIVATHDPTDEKVGFLSGLVLPSGKLAQHSDTFLLPNNVKVEYWFGDESPKFFAYLGMTPISANETQVLVTIGVKFGWLNPLISLALPTLIRKVLKQDEQILRQQRENLSLMSKRQPRSLQSDAIDATVHALRSHCRDPRSPRPSLGTRRIRVCV